MKTTALAFALLGCLSLFVETSSGQLFRRRAPRNYCCCPPQMIVMQPSRQVIYGSPVGIANSYPVAALPSISSVPVPSAPLVPSPAGNAATNAGSVSETPVIIATEPIVSPSDATVADEIVGAVKKVDDPKSEWKTLFDGKTLGDWVATRFGGEGEVRVEDGNIDCDFGQYITGVTYKGKDLPKNNYEIELEAMRVDGGDFFCGLTFPVDDKHATFVVGGWGGSVTGISNIDEYDASENDTTDYMQFENKKWYKIRVRVTKGVLEAWINDKKMVSKDVESSRLSTRIEMDPCKPLGIACFDTHAAYRNIRIRPEPNPDTKSKK